MECFQILYTTDKSKKSKKWHDGVMKYNSKYSGYEVFNDQSKKIGMLHSVNVQVGNILETDNLLVNIDSLMDDQSNTTPLYDTSIRRHIEAVEQEPVKEQSAKRKYKPPRQPVSRGPKEIARLLSQLLPTTPECVPSVDHVCTDYIYEPMLNLPSTDSPLPYKLGVLNSYNSYQEYIEYNIGLIEYCINHSIHDAANRYRHVLGQHCAAYLGDNSPNCHCGMKGKVRQVVKVNENQGRFYYHCGRTRGQLNFSNSVQCPFFKWTAGVDPSRTVETDSNSHRFLSLCRKNDLIVYSGCAITRKSNNLFTLKISQRLDKSSVFNKGDVWAVSTQVTLTDVTLLRSRSFGPSSSGFIDVELMSPIGNILDSSCYVLLVDDLSGDVFRLVSIKAELGSAPNFPLLPHILSAQSVLTYFTMVEMGKAHGVLEDILRRFSLNPDQRTVLQQVVNVLTGECSVPIIIVEGVFGSGKSFLLGVLIVLLKELSLHSSELVNAVLCALTNVAVDRVLSILHDITFHDFIRVGSYKRIDKTLIPHSIHADRFKEGSKLTQAILGTFLVGVTCASCDHSSLNDCNATVMLLDEASQMVESAAFIAILKFKPRILIAFGDSKQLGPALPGKLHQNTNQLTLFGRLQQLDYPTYHLTFQYRCAPVISQIANHLFYAGIITDGSPPPPSNQLPALLFVDVKGESSEKLGGSYSNVGEARLCAMLAVHLIKSGLWTAFDIGLLTFFKAQVSEIGKQLDKFRVDVQNMHIATADAFQGAERRVMVLSCVKSKSLAFLCDERRVNVSLTRARTNLIIVGDCAALRVLPLWSRIIGYFEEHGSVVDSEHVKKMCHSLQE